MSPSADRSFQFDNPKALREMCETAARIGGRIAREGFGTVHAVKIKADASQVTNIDVAAEQAVIAHIRAARPLDWIIGEESVAARLEEDSSLDATVLRPGDEPPALCWVIDPIDGTRNYINGIPLYGCSVGVMRAGVPVAGAIFDPMRDVMISAATGEGAYLDGKPVRLEAGGARNESQWVVAIPSQRYGQWHRLTKDWIEHLVVRNLGTTALHIALVAGGQLDAALMTKCKLWDIAAGWAIVTAAGGLMTKPDGKPLFPIDLSKYVSESMPALAARPEIHAKLVGQDIS